MLQDEALGAIGFPRRRAARRVAAALALWIGTLVPAAADVCEEAALTAADAHGVPRAVMRAVLRVETGEGRGAARRGWPWSANADGASHRFDSFEAALAFARGPVARVAGNVDLGCFQISERWHGAEFAGPEEMLDPRRNALYAARLLAGHHARTGDWTLAAGSYHSFTEPLAAAYRTRFRSELAALGAAPPATRLAEAPQAPARRVVGRVGRASPLRAGGETFTQVAGLAPTPGRVGAASDLDPRPDRAADGLAPMGGATAPVLADDAASPAPSADLAPARLPPDAPLPSHPPLVERTTLASASPLTGGARPLLGGGGAGAAGSLVPRDGGLVQPLFHRAPEG